MPTQIFSTIFLSKYLLFLISLINIKQTASVGCQVTITRFYKLEALQKLEFQISKHFAHWLNSSELSLFEKEKAQFHLQLFLTNEHGKLGKQQLPNNQQSEELISTQNPICLYKLVWKIRLLLENVLSNKFFSNLDPASQELIIFLWKNGWPEIKQNIENILMLQLVQNLDAEQISNGQISNLHTNCSLNSLNCFEIGSHAMKTKQHTFAITWLELARRKALVDGQTSLVNTELALRNAITNHNKELDSSLASFVDDRFYHRKIRPNVPTDFLRPRKLLDFQLKTNAGKRESFYEKLNYIGLCSGRNYQSEKEKSTLFCWREFKMDASLTIGPAKLELLARSPDILQIYDFMSEKETQKLVIGSNESKNPAFQTTSVRTFEAITGQKFVKETRNPWQIEIHPPGSHFLPGKDRVKNTLSASSAGKQTPLATFMIHLNEFNDSSGGEIAFAYSGTVARPIKGSAVFWFNSRPDGSVDKNANHGLCPVLVGNTFVAQMRIPFDGKSILGKCGLRKNNRFEIPANNMCFQIPELPQPKVPKRQKEAKPPSSSDFLKYSYISPPGLTQLVQLEWKIYPEIKSMYEKHLNQTRSIKRGLDESNKEVMTCLKDFEDSIIKLVGNLKDLPLNDLNAVRKVALNPLAIYKVIARFRNYYLPWTVANSQPANKLKSKISSYLDQVYDVSGGPLSEDFESAKQALLKIQIIYDLPVKDMAVGYIDDVNARVTLNAHDCFLIGKKGLSKKYFTAAVEWLEHALYLVEKTGDNSIELEDVLDELATTEMSHDEDLPKKRWVDYHFFVNPLSQTRFPSHRIKHSSIENQIVKNNSNIDNYYDSKLWRVCSGKTTQSAAEKSKLFCWYETEIHKTYKIGPIKAELFTLSNVSQIIQYHDVLGDKTIEEMKLLTFDKPTRVTFGDAEFDPFKSHAIRKTDHNCQYNASISTMNLLERFTGYKKAHKSRPSEYHYAVYGPGAAQRRHYDAVFTEHHGKHSLLAQFVFYLNNVEKGGETAFPRLKLKVTPKKGSVVLWVNALSEGTLDSWVEHASCPVVFGEKWIFATDVFQADQNHLQCHLNRHTPYPVLVNGKPIY